MLIATDIAATRVVAPRQVASVIRTKLANGMLAARAKKTVHARVVTDSHTKRTHQLAIDTSRVDTGSCEKRRVLFSRAFRCDTLTASSTEVRPTGSRNTPDRSDNESPDRTTTVIPMKDKKRTSRKNIGAPHTTRS